MARWRLISAILFCTYIAVVIFVCFSRPETLPTFPELWFGIPVDKAGHFLMFVPYPILAYIVFHTADMSKWRLIALFAVIIATGSGLAAGTERLQAHLAYRSAEWQDLHADMAGMLTGALALAAYTIRKKH